MTRKQRLAARASSFEDKTLLHGALEAGPGDLQTGFEAGYRAAMRDARKVILKDGCLHGIDNWLRPLR